MAKSTDNILLKGASGTIADMLTLTKRRSGNIILGKKRRRSNIPPTDAQIEVQQRFKKSILYAKAVLRDPVKKAMYEKAAGPDQSAYNMAMRDAFKLPVVESIDTTKYLGGIGDVITVRAYDDFKLVSVKVSIRTAAGAVIEAGDAILQDNGLDWTYTATVDNAAAPGSVITAIATDTPGNQMPREVEV
ncbi:hypothetical protein [Chitinophaga agri]|uniref:Uncharacterized protein n=1 Tax=Chitinophaga agri TaxID=2703787 RepID=A0A6B9ZIZ1_9BACT|nr:hypothetical protein [Chitinophaga agri]QHS61055.1 hypothetical protein GWR21_16045 [Chitinophaga agri]